MAIIKILNQLYLIDGLLSDNRNQKIHHRQGDFGGACAIYSTMMALQLEGFIKCEQLNPSYRLDRRKPIESFIAQYVADKGFIRDGYHLKKLCKEVMATFPQCKAEYIDTTKKSKINDRIADIKGCIDENIPVVIGIDWDNYHNGHALLAIGYEENNDRVTKILCIDPGYDIPDLCYWNVYIDTEYRKGRFCCKYNAIGRVSPLDDSDNVELRDYLCLYKNE